MSRVACPAARLCRSGRRTVTNVANMAMFDGVVSRIAGGIGRVGSFLLRRDRLVCRSRGRRRLLGWSGWTAELRGYQRGSARVCWDPLIAARSGIRVAASAWNVMFDVPEIRIAAAG